MTEENTTPVRRLRFGYVLAIAVIIALLIMGNVVTYAVTGETAVEKVVNVVKSATMHKTEEYIDDDGNKHVKYEINNSEASAEFDAIIYDSEFNIDISEDLSEAEDGNEVIGAVEIIISDKDSDTSETGSTSTPEISN
ncbi:MAG: hypothetical protein ACI4II_09880 [Acutalibacteraceae bacterium]